MQHMVARYKVVIDTNVLVSALRSRLGASFALLLRIESGDYQPVVTVPLAMEYDDVLHRAGVVPISSAAVDAVLDRLFAMAVQQSVHFLWRPRLRDPKDDMVLEAAANGQVDFLVTHNVADFAEARTFSIAVVTPAQFLHILDGAPE
jgi:putative PIN family toxin of toxin-antitoxin system